MKWGEIKLKQLIKDIGDGGTPSTSDELNFGGNISWAVVEDIKPEIYSTQQKLTEKGFNSCSAKLWPKESIIVTTGATIGEVGIAKIELCTKQGITGIVPNEYANNLYLRYWLEQNKNQLLRYSQGTTFKEIRPRPLGNLKIKIPEPLTEKSVEIQEKIASIISLVDKNIEQTNEVIKKAERLKKSMMQNLLTGKIKPDGTIRKKEEFQDIKLEKIPMKPLQKFIGKDVPVGWTIEQVTGSIDLVYGEGLGSENLNGGDYPVYGSNGIMGYYNEFLVEGPGIIVGRKGTAGSIKWSDKSFYPIDTTYYIKLKGDLNLRWVYYSLINLDLIRLNAATGVPGLNRRDALALYILKPSKEEQEGIANKIDLFYNKIRLNKIKLKKLQRLKKSLMQNLLTGKVEVKL